MQNLLTIDSDFDVTITGFEIPEIDLILTTDHGKPDPDDDVETTKIGEAVTRPGDLWQLGRHRLFCGSAIEPASFSSLLGSRRADVVFVDPPYNVEIDGNVSGNGSIRHREFGMASGEMGEFEFTTFLAASLRLLARYSAGGSVHFVCMDWRHMGELLSAGRQVYDSLLNLCVWIKNNGGMILGFSADGKSIGREQDENHFSECRAVIYDEDTFRHRMDSRHQGMGSWWMCNGMETQGLERRARSSYRKHEKCYLYDTANTGDLGPPCETVAVRTNAEEN